MAARSNACANGMLLAVAVLGLMMAVSADVLDQERRTDSAGKSSITVSIVHGNSLSNASSTRPGAAFGRSSSSLVYAGETRVAASRYLADSTDLYFARMKVGGTREFYMVVDTGSDLTWIQCQPCVACFDQIDMPVFNPSTSTSLRKVGYKSPLCAPQGWWVVRPVLETMLCAYEMSYAEGLKTAGILVQDTLALAGSGHSFQAMPFGCSPKSSSVLPTAVLGGAAGILGLGSGSLSFLSQLRQRGLSDNFSYCLPDMFSSSTSDLTFGGPIAPNLIFIPLLPNPINKHLYYVPLVGFSVGRTRLSIPARFFKIDSTTGDGGAIIDSGYSKSSVPTPVYNEVQRSFTRAVLQNAKQLSRVEPMRGTCYLLKDGFQANQLYDGVPSLTLHFAGNADLELPPANVLVYIQRKPRTDKRLCLSLEPEDSDPTIVIGNIQQQRIRFTFDSKNQRLGFAPNAC